MPGWPVYKIKLGTDDDLAIITRIGEAHLQRRFSRRRQLRLTVEQTIGNGTAMEKNWAWSSSKQPLSAADRRAQAEARNGSCLPIIAPMRVA